MSYLTTVLCIGLIITLHEAGHLLAARLCKIPIARFSVGIGPKLLGFERGGTSYWLSALPLGGYVLPDLDEDGMKRLPVSRRIVFYLGGPLANLAGALVLLLAWNLVSSELTLLGAVGHSVTQLLWGMQQVLSGLLSLFSSPEGLSGIVGVVTAGGTEHATSLVGLLSFAVVINVNLAVLNLLPLPPLDGGRILLCLLEWLHRPLLRLERPLTLTGAVLLLSLMVYATVQDVVRLSDGGLT